MINQIAPVELGGFTAEAEALTATVKAGQALLKKMAMALSLVLACCINIFAQHENPGLLDLPNAIQMSVENSAQLKKARLEKKVEY